MTQQTQSYQSLATPIASATQAAIPTPVPTSATQASITPVSSATQTVPLTTSQSALGSKMASNCWVDRLAFLILVIISAFFTAMVMIFPFSFMHISAGEAAATATTARKTASLNILFFVSIRIIPM